MAQLKKKRWLFTFCLAIFCTAIVGGYLAVRCMRLEKIADRPLRESTMSRAMAEAIEEECAELEEAEAIIKRCSRIVCDSLQFSYQNDLAEGKANCVGYAQLTAETLNHAFRTKGLPFRAKPVYGRFHLMGNDIHPFIMTLLPSKYKSFFYDHDYTEINLDGEKVFIDTSLQDLLPMIPILQK